MTAELPTPGTIVDAKTARQLEPQGVRVRFGIVLAPEPSERVKRITSDDPAVWRPAIDEFVDEVWPFKRRERLWPPPKDRQR